MTPRPKRKYWYKGKILHTADILKLSGVPMGVYKMRIRRGWPLILAMAVPVKSDTPTCSISDVVYEVEAIIQGEFHQKTQHLVPADDSRIKVYENMLRSGEPVAERWVGDKGFQRFLEDMGPRPINTEFRMRNAFLGYTPENCLWGKRS